MSLNLTEARARAALVHDVRTRVALDLTDPDWFTVRAAVSFGCRESGATTFLELADATDVLVEAGDNTQTEYDGRRITLRGLGAHNEVTITARLPYVIDGDGMTTVIDPADGERYVSAFTAMDIAQRVLPCFDQPDLKTTFEVSVTAPSHWTVLANGALTRRDGDTWHFGVTPPISSYLFFVTGGPFVSMTWEEPYAPAPGGSLAFGWHARASQAAQLEREGTWLREVTSGSFAEFTSMFEAPYAFADYQQVFSPGLNWGAMEFPGCVSFRDEYLTAGEPTTLQRQALSSVIAHEMAHMWFGDLVTMRWWEDTWLNESFADFMGYEVSGRVRGADSWVAAALVRKPSAYWADARRSTHPIAEDAENLVDVDTAFANFDMITYAKGNAVLRQLVTWLGEDDFLTGVNAHLNAHPFGNATLADFLDALDTATERDVRGWADAWLRSTGFDRIRVTRQGEKSRHGQKSRHGDVPVLVREGSRPHRFTVTGYDADLRVVRELLVDLGAEPVELPDFAGLSVLPNSADETYAALEPDAESWTAICAGLSRIEAPLSRALVWATACARTERGDASLASLVELAATQLRTELDPAVFEGALALVLRLVATHSTPDDIAGHTAALADLARHVRVAGPESHRAAASRLLATTGGDAAELSEWLDSGIGLIADDQELRWLVVTRLAELGTDAPIAAELERDVTSAGAQAALRSRAAVPTSEAKAWAWERLVSGELSNRDFSAVLSGFWGWEQGDLVAPWIVTAPAALADLAARSGQAMGQLIGRALPKLPMDTATARALEVALVDVLETGVATVTARGFNDQLDDLRIMLTARAQGPGMRSSRGYGRLVP